MSNQVLEARLHNWKMASRLLSAVELFIYYGEEGLAGGSARILAALYLDGVLDPDARKVVNRRGLSLV